MVCGVIRCRLVPEIKMPSEDEEIELTCFRERLTKKRRIRQRGEPTIISMMMVFGERWINYIEMLLHQLNRFEATQNEIKLFQQPYQELRITQFYMVSWRRFVYIFSTPLLNTVVKWRTKFISTYRYTHKTTEQGKFKYHVPPSQRLWSR